MIADQQSASTHPRQTRECQEAQATCDQRQEAGELVRRAVGECTEFELML